ncbi:MAG TPA: ABC transporter permease [Candidatus Mediterraneibacter surreyensis]|nr:ABC transporter permease [Candidatus Mediterraneibacter surreyensis]
MSFRLEYKKIRRTGLTAAFLAGGIIAAALPVINTAARPDTFTSMAGSPAAVLADANLQLISMLNLLLITAGACILYHIEYADNALQKMQSLPVRESRLFIGKCGILLPFFLMIILFETASLCFCGWHWLDAGKEELMEILQTLGFTLILTLPSAIIALVIASACRNMWTALGIGILCIFMATMLPTDNFIVSLFPYVLPFQILPGMETARVFHYCIASVCESAAACAAEIIYLKVRRLFA